MTKKVIDTNILLNYPEIILTEDCILPSVVIAELEHIKVSMKSDDVKFQARKATRTLTENDDKYTVHIVTKSTYDIVEKYNLPIDNDNLIIASCLEIDESVVFCSNDLCARLIAKDIFQVDVESYGKDKVDNIYKGYKEVCLEEREMARFYENLKTNTYECLENQYIIIKNIDGETEEIRRWTSECGYVAIFNKIIKSNSMDLKLKAKDEYQLMAIDSLYNNEITVLTGRAGAGKTTLPLGYFMSNIENKKIDKLYIIYHFEPLKGAKTLGFEKGDHITKILESGSIGNLLTSKFGSITEVERLIADDKIEIIPTANIRGVEFGSESAIFVTECQDIDAYTLKTIIQRCKSGCKQVYEGDTIEQSDIVGREIGLNKMIDIFKDCDKFGYVKLKNNYRSDIIGNLADKM